MAIREFDRRISDKFHLHFLKAFDSVLISLHMARGGYTKYKNHEAVLSGHKSSRR